MVLSANLILNWKFKRDKLKEQNFIASNFSLLHKALEKLRMQYNPNSDRHDMRHDIINGGFKMFRNVDTFWNTWEKQERWHGPMVCWGVDFNNRVYNTPCGDYMMVRDLTAEEMDRLVEEIRKTEGLVELVNSEKLVEDV